MRIGPLTSVAGTSKSCLSDDTRGVMTQRVLMKRDRLVTTQCTVVQRVRVMENCSNVSDSVSTNK